jgi:hypothetical protein
MVRGAQSEHLVGQLHKTGERFRRRIETKSVPD